MFFYKYLFVKNKYLTKYLTIKHARSIHCTIHTTHLRNIVYNRFLDYFFVYSFKNGNAKYVYSSNIRLHITTNPNPLDCAIHVVKSNDKSITTCIVYRFYITERCNGKLFSFGVFARVLE